jgi:hypothetical protein
VRVESEREEMEKRRAGGGWLRSRRREGEGDESPVAFKPLRSRHFKILIIDSLSHAAIGHCLVLVGCGTFNTVWQKRKYFCNSLISLKYYIYEVLKWSMKLFSF